MTKLILITGGSLGIGKALAENFLKKDASVIVTSRKYDFFNSTQIEAGKIIRQQLDVTSEDSVKKLFAWISSLNIKLDVLINGAGYGVFKSFDAITLEEWNAIINTNLTGAFLCAQMAYRMMVNQGGGRIINIGSIANKIPLEGNVAYGASKYGLRGLSKIIAEEGKLKKIRVTHVNLGAVYTEMWHDRNGFSKEDMLTTNEVSDILAYLAYLPLNIRIDEIDITPEKGVL